MRIVSRISFVVFFQDYFYILLIIPTLLTDISHCNLIIRSDNAHLWKEKFVFLDPVYADSLIAAAFIVLLF